SQMTGDTIHLKSNPETEKLDSLLVFDNAFLIQKDSIEGYNQVKGKELTGLFIDNDLYQVDIVKNAEILYYTRNENKDLVGINKTLCSTIKVLFENREITDFYCYTNVDGTLSPEEEVPQNIRLLTGFNWRGDEQLMQKSDLFAGKAPPQLVRIQGIPLPEVEEDFFDDTERETPLLNENSRLKPEDLKDKKIDSIIPPPATRAPVLIKPGKEEDEQD
ncbi:MAG TPA: hypothetical protein VLN46_00825, partial [Gillisia sp.]|nr:hypothetical protein [Gillisia sp.]